jgi:uracil-DNA glycosylase family 4
LIDVIDNKQAELDSLRERVISCRNCPRLVSYVSKVSREKVHRYRDWSYWGRPLPGFGDPEARLLVIGLAPAAHGGNRTGRMFTGDSSGDWLIRALHETGFSNQPESVSSEDGLELESAYITAAVRCAPPKNRPLSEEIRNCSEYLKEEARLLDKVEVVLTLGRIAFDTYNKYMLVESGGPKPGFRHGGFYDFRGTPSLVTSYHPSRQNTQTGRLTWEMWMGVFNMIRNMLR